MRIEKLLKDELEAKGHSVDIRANRKYLYHNQKVR